MSAGRCLREYDLPVPERILRSPRFGAGEVGGMEDRPGGEDSQKGMGQRGRCLLSWIHMEDTRTVDIRRW